jgi:hypothetical protein
VDDFDNGNSKLAVNLDSTSLTIGYGLTGLHTDILGLTVVEETNGGLLCSLLNPTSP